MFKDLTDTAKSGSKASAFQIRTNILELSKDYLDSVHKLNLDLAGKLIAEGIKSNTEALDMLMKQAPTMYTVDSWLETAEKLNKFVSGNAYK